MLESLLIVLIAVLIHNKGPKLIKTFKGTYKQDSSKDLSEYSLKPLFKTWSIYPFIILFLIYMVLQMEIFMGNNSVANLKFFIKAGYIISLGAIVFEHKLFKPGVIGGLLFIGGGLLNTIVINANSARMPVYPTFSITTGYIKNLNDLNDGLHIIGSASTNLKFLTDWIDDGWNIMSPGDILQRVFAVIVIYYAIKVVNEINFVGKKL